MYGLNIHLFSFNLYINDIRPNDKIRVSITSLPEEKKQAFIIDAKEVNDIHHFFNINITDKTQKIIFVFRKKSFLHSDPIIASTIVGADKLPKMRNSSANTEIKQINIFEPVARSNNNNYNLNESRKVIGQMQIQMSLENAFPEGAISTKNNYNYNISKIQRRRLFMRWIIRLQ